MQVLVKVVDRDEFDKNMYTGVVYTHETNYHGQRYDLQQMYNEPMVARFIITLAALTNHCSYDLFIHQTRPCITFQYDEKCLSVVITYYVKKL